jgi:hypothetical protein
LRADRNTTASYRLDAGMGPERRRGAFLVDTPRLDSMVRYLFYLRVAVPHWRRSAFYPPEDAGMGSPDRRPFQAASARMLPFKREGGARIGVIRFPSLTAQRFPG